MNTFALRIKHCRGKESTSSFAEKLGISAGALNSYERGLSTPSSSKLVQIAERLGVSTEWILNGEEESECKEEQLYSSQNSEQHFQGTGEVLLLYEEIRILEKEMRSLGSEVNNLLKENGDLRVEVERLKSQVSTLAMQQGKNAGADNQIRMGQAG